MTCDVSSSYNFLLAFSSAFFHIFYITFIFQFVIIPEDRVTLHFTIPLEFEANSY